MSDFVIRGEPLKCAPFAKSLGHHLLECMQLHGTRKLQIDPCTDKVRTMEEVRKISVRTALAMRKRGVKINDVITICSKNHPNMIVPMLGAIYLGAASQHINASYTKRNIVSEPTWAHLTPSIAHEISTDLTEDKYNCSDLKIIWIGGDVSTPTQLAVYREKFKNIFVANVCSSTEMLMPYGFFHPIFEYGLNLDKVNSLGRLFPGMEAKIVDPDTKEVLGWKEEGELLMKSPTMMTGYYKDSEATAQTIDVNGWLHTGDLCYIDEDECLFYVDRLKQALKYKLYHIIPYELELIIETHPAVSKACVVGIPHDVDGDHAMAFVEKYPGFEVTTDEILEHVNQNVNEYQKLRGGVRFIDKMPLTSTGHTRRNFLKKQLYNSL